MSNENNERETARVGMWIFLATEVMLFGGLFAVYTIYHQLFHDAFLIASRKMDFWLGSLNTAILLTSSLTMALGVHAAQRAEQKTLLKYLALTILLGGCFLGIKAVEYSGHIHDGLFPGRHFVFQPGLAPSPPGTELFFCLYFIMTGLHAAHMLIGIGLLSFLTVKATRGRDGVPSPLAVELIGLYWHFIDVVWIFLFPLFYLIGGHG